MLPASATFCALVSLALVPVATPGDGARAPGVDRGTPRTSIELPSTPWVAGDVIHAEANSHSTIHTIIVSGGQLLQEFDQLEDKQSDKTIHVLSCDEHGPTKLRVEYGVLRFVQDAGAPRTAENGAVDVGATRNPLEHKTFFLLRRGDTFRVLDANEKRVEEGLAQLVLEEEGLHELEIRRAGDLVARELAGRPLILGSEIACSRDVARAFVDGHEHLDNARLVLGPKETREEAGEHVLVCTAHLEITDAGGSEQPTTTIELWGDMRFDLASGRFLAVELAGTLNLARAVADQTHGIEVTGQGPWTISERVRYGRAP